MKTKLESLKEAYFHWLVYQVGEHERMRYTYWDVLRLMHDKEFVWIVSNDDNRMVDAMDLRVEFIREHRTREQYTQDHFGFCTVLEVMIGISRRLSFAVNDDAEVWAFVLLKNLGFKTAIDPLSHRKSRQINNRLDNLVWRNYNPDGSGGFFPLRNPMDDQTRVEIWYQMAAYINEM